jgi:hypothetical protein
MHCRPTQSITRTLAGTITCGIHCFIKLSACSFPVVGAVAELMLLIANFKSIASFANNLLLLERLLQKSFVLAFHIIHAFSTIIDL